MYARTRAVRVPRVERRRHRRPQVLIGRPAPRCLEPSNEREIAGLTDCTGGVRHHSPVEIVNEDTHRVLAYVDALNRHGVRPHCEVVNEFACNPERKYRSDGILAVRSSLATILDGQRKPTETFCQYLARLSWINDDPAERVELTPIGRALLRALNSPTIEETSTDVFEVVLSPDNPFAYAQALGGLSYAKEALLVEPYLRLDQLIDIAGLDNIVRVLVGGNLKSKEYELLATGLASLPEGRSLEIRKAQSLHDRYLISKGEGQVLMLGASLGGIGKKVSTMTTLGEVASRALRDAHEAIWREAERIEPKKPAIVASALTGSAKESESSPPLVENKIAKKSVAKQAMKKSPASSDSRE